MPPKYIKRITLFKIPSEYGIQTALDSYKILRETAKKDGKPYIVHNEAARIFNNEEARSKGFTVSAQTTFSSIEDLQYYDNECEAHGKLKTTVTPLREDVMVLLFESDIPPRKGD